MNIVLIGRMGAGKSTVGKKLKELIDNYSFVDTDEEIVKQEGKSINDIFAQNGEAYFREIETKILKTVLCSDNQIISTGGGIVTSDENIKELKQKSFVIYLKSDKDTLFERVKNNKERPLLNEGDVKTKIEILLIEREDKYEKAAHKIINTNDKTPETIAKEIAGII